MSITYHSRSPPSSRSPVTGKCVFINTLYFCTLYLWCFFCLSVCLSVVFTWAYVSYVCVLTFSTLWFCLSVGPTATIKPTVTTTPTASIRPMPLQTTAAPTAHVSPTQVTISSTETTPTVTPPTTTPAATVFLRSTYSLVTSTRSTAQAVTTAQPSASATMWVEQSDWSICHSLKPNNIVATTEFNS